MQHALCLNTVAFLHWIARQPRCYGETLEAWRSSCPRLTAWEDSLADGLVTVEKTGARPAVESMVVLTPRGRAAIAATIAQEERV
jgi:hypothetical protein